MGKLTIETVGDLVLAQGKRVLLGNVLNTCVYWVDGVIIDTGPSSLAREYQGFFREKKVSKVMLTHNHEDHCGNATLLVRQGVPAYLHEMSVPVVARPERIPLYRWAFWRPRPPFKALPVPPSVETDSGKKIQVVEAPGHTADHLAFFYGETGALFTGDLFVSTSTKMGMPGENYVKWMDTLERLLQLDFDLICCGHSGIVKNGKQILARKLKKLQELQETILTLRDKGLTVGEINKELFSGLPLRRIVSGGEWDSIHIVRSFIQHSGKST